MDRVRYRLSHMRQRPIDRGGRWGTPACTRAPEIALPVLFRVGRQYLMLIYCGTESIWQSTPYRSAVGPSLPSASLSMSSASLRIAAAMLASRTVIAHRRSAAAHA